MSQVTAYTQLYPYLVPRLPGADPTSIILLTLKEVTRRFCEDTEAFRDDLDQLGVTDYKQDYRLTAAHEYDAAIHRLRTVTVNQTVYGPSQYELLYETHLRFAPSALPADLDNELLVCGTAGITDIADWNSVTDGSVVVPVDNSTYSLASLDCSSDTTMDEVAGTIQTALRDSIGSNKGFVRWAQDHFNVYNPGGVVSYLTAGSTGTDISGAGYMNGLTGTGTLSGSLLVEAVFRPEINTESLPNWFLDRWSDAIIAGTIAELAEQPKKPYTNPDLARKMLTRYNVGKAKAIREQARAGTAALDDLS